MEHRQIAGRGVIATNLEKQYKSTAVFQQEDIFKE